MTVSTFFPDGDPEDTSVDGRAFRFIGAGEAFATIRAGAGTGSNSGGTTEISPVLQADATTDLWETLSRAILLFDTASLPDGDTITAATFELVLTALTSNFGGSVALVPSTPATNAAVVDADFSQLGTTRQASDRTLAGLTVDSTTYNAWTLNAAGLASVDAAGVTKLGMRLADDLDNTEPTWSAFAQDFIRWAAAEEVLADDKRPKLVVTHDLAVVAGPDVPAAGIGQMAGNAPHSFRTRMVGT